MSRLDRPQLPLRRSQPAYVVALRPVVRNGLNLVPVSEDMSSRCVSRFWMAAYRWRGVTNRLRVQDEERLEICRKRTTVIGTGKEVGTHGEGCWSTM